MEYLRTTLSAPPDVRGSTFPIINGGFFALFAILTPMILLLKIIGPSWMRNRKPMDLGPFMLIYNGLMFGINGAGFLMTLAVTEMTHDVFGCGRARPSDPGLKSSAIIYLGYTYFLVKFLEFIRIGFAVLRKRDEQATLGAILNPAAVTLIVHTGLYYYPGGIFAFLPLADTFTSSLVYSYYVLASAKQINFERWKRPMICLQLIHYAALFTHAIHFLTQPNCGVPHIVLHFQAIYALSCLIQYPITFSNVLFKSSSMSSPKYQKTLLSESLTQENDIKIRHVKSH